MGAGLRALRTHSLSLNGIRNIALGGLQLDSVIQINIGRILQLPPVVVAALFETSPGCLIRWV